MRTEFFYDSKGVGKIHAIRWTPEGEVKAVVQIVHGIAEYALRYDEFARYLNGFGILVVAEDHMGHGGSIENGGTRGYFDGGWFTAVEDTYQLLTDIRRELPDIPYILYGHSMGSFVARTILARYPDSGIAAAVLSGTGWVPNGVLAMMGTVCAMLCRTGDERKPNEKLQNMIFGGYNKRVEHPRTEYDWLSRDASAVDAYVADPMCGFAVSTGLQRDLADGMRYIQKGENLHKMRKDLPVLFIAGGDDPVGSYGKGVRQTAEAFKAHGMDNVSVRIYPLCRHEIHNEINREEIFEDVVQWIKKSNLLY